MTNAQRGNDPDLADPTLSPLGASENYLFISNSEWKRSCSSPDPALIEQLLAKAKLQLDAGKKVAILMEDESGVLLGAHRRSEIQEISNAANRTRRMLNLCAVLHPT